MPLSLLSLRPGKPSPDSCLTMGAALGSMDTADLMGKTRSIEPGLRTEPGPSNLCVKVGEGGTSDLPVNMEMLDSRGSRETQPGGRG